MTQYTIYRTQEYKEWFTKEPKKSQRQIQSRIEKIESDDYFGTHKYLRSADLWELKFNDGRRIYYVIIPESKVILLLGGNKNGQTKDIIKASKILGKTIQDGSG